MTNSELYERAIKKLNLKQEDIEDYGSASGLYIEQVTGIIPDAIIIWLKSGEQIVYMEPKIVREKKFLEFFEYMSELSDKNGLALMSESYVHKYGPFTRAVGEKVRMLLEEKSES